MGAGMKDDRNSRVRTFEQLNAGHIIDKKDTRKFRVELETDGNDHHTLIVSRRRRYRLSDGGNVFFWIAVYETALDEPEQAMEYRDLVDAVTDTEVDHEVTEKSSPQPGICTRIHNFFFS